MDYPYYAGEPRQWVTEMRREYYPIVSIPTEFDARENRGARTKFWVRIEGGTDRWLLKMPKSNTGEPLDRIGSVPEDEIRTTIQRVPAEFMSDVAKEFAFQVVMTGQRELLRSVR